MQIGHEASRRQSQAKQRRTSLLKGNKIYLNIDYEFLNENNPFLGHAVCIKNPVGYGSIVSLVMAIFRSPSGCGLTTFIALYRRSAVDATRSSFWKCARLVCDIAH